MKMAVECDCGKVKATIESKHLKGYRAVCLCDDWRHHNLHLHGSGVVCGLKVVQHDKDECRNRFVCVEPGTAIDCCGHEIVLRFKECIDLDTIPALKALKDKNDTTKHHLGGLHPLPRMRDRARAGAVRRVRLRRRQVRAQSRARGVRARRHGRSHAAGGAESSPTSAAISGARAFRAARIATSPTASCWRPSRTTSSARRSSTRLRRAATSGSVVIDNFTDRHILPSAQLIKEVIDCMLKQGPGGGGVQALQVPLAPPVLRVLPGRPARTVRPERTALGLKRI